MDKWDARFLRIADEVSTWSKDPSTKVGCVLVDANRHVIATGYNGFPRGVSDCCSRYADRDLKYMLTIHAEANAITQAVVPTEGATAYTTHQPCSNCAGLLIQAGIKRVVTYKPTGSYAERFAQSCSASSLMLAEADVELVTI